MNKNYKNLHLCNANACAHAAIRCCQLSRTLSPPQCSVRLISVMKGYPYRTHIKTWASVFPTAWGWLKAPTVDKQTSETSFFTFSRGKKNISLHIDILNCNLALLNVSIVIFAKRRFQFSTTDWLAFKGRRWTDFRSCKQSVKLRNKH